MREISMTAALILTMVAFAGIAAAASGRGSRTEHSGAAVSNQNLPFSQGLSFATLDAYLAHLQKRGMNDVPWYKRLPDGRYEHIVPFRRDSQGQQYFTRDELAKKFGFAN